MGTDAVNIVPKRKGTNRNSMSGLTLLGILIYITILGVLAAIVVPNLTRCCQ